STSVVFIDLDQFRSSPFLAALYSWAPYPAEESDYRQFISDTGFDYERDLSRVFIAISNHGRSSTLVLAEGKFQRKQIETYLSRNSQPEKEGNLVTFPVPARTGARSAWFAFLDDHRIAISDSDNLPHILSAMMAGSARAEWQKRFDRLAGSPLFAV